MFIKNKKISLVYKLIAIGAALFGQILALDIINGNFKADQFLFYTNQSNILCLIYFIFAAKTVYQSLKTKQSDVVSFAPRAKGAVVMAITVTMLIYWFMLDGQLDAIETEGTDGFSKLWPLTNYVVHLIVPLLTIFDWILFDPKGKYDILDPVRWLYIPLFYYVFALIVAQTGYLFYNESRFPYFFIDTDILGVTGVIKYVIILIFGFLLLGYIIFGVDKLLSKISEN